MNPDPERMSEPLWSLASDVLAHFGVNVELEMPRGKQHGYHMSRAELSTRNYSVRRAVDKLGPAYVFSAVDFRFKPGRTQWCQLVSKRLLDAYDHPDDGRVGTHNTAELFGTVDGETVAGRVHGRYSSNSDRHLHVVHIALDRRWAANDYVCRSMASVIVGESHEDWLQREHPRVRRNRD